MYRAVAPVAVRTTRTMTALSSSFSSRRRSTFPSSSSLSRRNNSKRVRPPKATNTKKNEDEDEDDEDNAETETISLTSNQARIAALAFDVLYNKPFLNEEQMMKDPERPKLRLMLREAIDQA